MKKYKFKIHGQPFEVDIKAFDYDKATVEVNGTKFEVDIERKKRSVPAIINRAPIATSTPVKQQVKAAPGAVVAPLPGSIFKLNVKEGDAVKRGDTVLIMEAMKMENNVLAEADGTVKKVMVKEGDSVLQGDALVEIG